MLFHLKRCCCSLLTSQGIGTTFHIDARRCGELSVLGRQSSAPGAPPQHAVVAWTNSERRSDDATPESVPPPPKGEGTVRRSSSSTLITRPANRTIEDKAD